METDAARPTPVNNALYSTLGERWYDANDDPVALLRAESRHRNPWISEVVTNTFGPRPCKILDVGCGAGFLSNHLALAGHEVIGLDSSPECLQVAEAHDGSRAVRYQVGDANHLTFGDDSFEVVCAMDFLEHVEDPARVIRELGRVLRAGGLFFFHTFNRNFLSWLVIIKGVEWFVNNTPHDMHVLRLFRKPAEIIEWCRQAKLELVTLHGSLRVFDAAMLRLLATGVVPPNFRFRFTSSTTLAYTGLAKKTRG